MRTVSYLLVDQSYALITTNHIDVDNTLSIDHFRESVKEECTGIGRDLDPQYLDIYRAKITPDHADSNSAALEARVRAAFRNKLVQKVESLQNVTAEEIMIVIVPTTVTIRYFVFDERKIHVSEEYIRVALNASTGDLKRNIKNNSGYPREIDPDRLVLYLERSILKGESHTIIGQILEIVSGADELCEATMVEELDISEEDTLLVKVHILTLVERKQLCALQDKARDLHDQLSRINEDKAATLRSINAIQSKTKSLPPEILSQIFQFTRPPIDLNTHTVPFRKYEDPEYPRESTYRRNEFVHFDLAAVSHLWRQVVWSTPGLWSSISIGIRKYTLENAVSCLRLHCENAGNLPLTIELDFRDQDSAELDDLRRLEPVKTILFCHIFPNAQELVLIGLPLEWIILSPNFELPQCVSLRIKRPQCWDNASWEVESAPINFVGSPRLRCIELREVFNVIPACSNATVLQFHYASVPVCIESLVKCPRLIKFECSEPVLSCRLLQLPDYIAPFVLVEHLEYFSWYDNDNFWDKCLFRHVRFVKLRILHLTSFWVKEELVHFFSKLPTTLSIITLGYFYGSVPQVASLLGWVPQLSELHLVDCGVDELIPILTDAIHNPANMVQAVPESYRDSYPKRPFLPCLSKLSISLSGRRIFIRPDHVIGMMAALHDTRGPGPEVFCLTLENGEGWNEKRLLGLKALVSAGFDMEVIFGSDRVDFDKI